MGEHGVRDTFRKEVQERKVATMTTRVLVIGDTGVL